MAAGPDIILAITYLTVWINPRALAEGTGEHLVTLMLVEFIVIHSSVLLGNALLNSNTIRARWAGFGMLFSFYMLFILGFSAAFWSLWPAMYFIGLTFNRFLGLLLGQAPSGDEKAMMMGLWGCSALYYILGVFITCLLPIPEFGLADFSIDLPGEGLWVDDPHRPIACGFIYFALNGWTALKASSYNWRQTAASSMS